MFLTIALLCLVTFMAGLIDSIAGGGGLLRLPALLVAGVSPQEALGTNKFTGSIGTGAALLNFARKGLIPWRLALVGIPCALIGSGGEAAAFSLLTAKQRERYSSPCCPSRPS